jgi:hypothetical protein
MQVPKRRSTSSNRLLLCYQHFEYLIPISVTVRHELPLLCPLLAHAEPTLKPCYHMAPPLCPLRPDADLDPLLEEADRLAKELPPSYSWLDVQTAAGAP